MARSRRKKFKWSSMGEYIKIGAVAVMNTFNRFPLTVLLFISLSVVVLMQVENSYENVELFDLLNRLIGVHVLAISLSFAVEALLERFAQGKWLVRIPVYLLELALVYAYFEFVYKEPNFAVTLQLLLLTAALTFVFLVVPYFFRRANYELFINRIMTHTVVSLFFAVVIGLGLSATVFAVESLLVEGLRGETYAYVWTFAMLIFAPIFLMAGLPHRDEEYTLTDFNKVLEILVLYIVMPLLVIYSVVLYIYFAKVLITQDWPKGIVSYLVVSYTAIGILMIFLANPFRQVNRWARIFTNGFTFLVLPLLAMMFVAIGIRINQYGFTENRYFIVLIGIWSVLAVLYVIFNRGKNNVFLPLLLAIFLAVAAVGPVSATNISINSQADRFYSAVESYDILRDGVITHTNKAISVEDQKEIIGALEYFDRSHSLADLKYLPEGFTMSMLEEYLGFKQYEWDDGRYKHFEYYREEPSLVVIDGYDIFGQVQMYNYIIEETIASITYDEQEYRLKRNDRFNLAIERDSEIIYQFDMAAYVKDLYHQYYNEASKGGRITDDLTLLDESDIVSVLYQFTMISASNYDDVEELRVENVQANLYIKIKDK